MHWDILLPNWNVFIRELKVRANELKVLQIDGLFGSLTKPRRFRMLNLAWV